MAAYGTHDCDVGFFDGDARPDGFFLQYGVPPVICVDDLTTGLRLAEIPVAQGAVDLKLADVTGDGLPEIWGIRAAQCLAFQL